MLIKNIFGHLKTVLTHKYWVFYYSCKLGIPWRGFVHDLSKFSPIEFWESVKYYQGGKSSPINACKADKGYSLAWQHHKGRNPHHYEYWVDKFDEGGVAINMPMPYKLEMLADYFIGQGKMKTARFRCSRMSIDIEFEDKIQEEGKLPETVKQGFSLYSPSVEFVEKIMGAKK